MYTASRLSPPAMARANWRPFRTLPRPRASSACRASSLPMATCTGDASICRAFAKSWRRRARPWSNMTLAHVRGQVGIGPCQQDPASRLCRPAEVLLQIAAIEAYHVVGPLRAGRELWHQDVARARQELTGWPLGRTPRRPEVGAARGPDAQHEGQGID